MKSKSLKVLFLTTLIFSFILTGCQPLSTSMINLNEMIKQETIPANSYELKETITLDLEYDEEVIYAELLPFYQLLDESKLDIYIQKNGNNLRAEGTFSVYKGEIPFKISASEEQIVIWIDDAVQPIVFEGEYLEDFKNENSEVYFYGSDIEEFYESDYGRTILDVYDFSINNLPNPTTLSYSLYQNTTLNGEKVYLNKIDSKISAAELPDLTTKFLNNAKNDEALKLLLKSIYISFGSEIFWAEQYTSEAEIDAYVEEQYAFVLQIIEELIVDIEKGVEAGEWMYGEETYLTSSLYLDNNMRVVKGNNTLVFEVPEAEIYSFDGILGFTINSSFERYNINEDITVDLIDVTDISYITIDNSKQELIDSLNKDGVFYDILKYDYKLIPEKTMKLTLGEQEVEIYHEQNGKSNTLQLDIAPYVKDGTTLVPLRFVSETLGADVGYNKATKEITITDRGTIIVLTLNSNIAYVNGEEVYLTVEPEVINGTTMVPFRFIGEALNAEVSWDYETQSITIEQYN